VSHDEKTRRKSAGDFPLYLEFAEVNYERRDDESDVHIIENLNERNDGSDDVQIIEGLTKQVGEKQVTWMVWKPRSIEKKDKNKENNNHNEYGQDTNNRKNSHSHSRSTNDRNSNYSHRNSNYSQNTNDRNSNYSQNTNDRNSNYRQNTNNKNNNTHQPRNSANHEYKKEEERKNTPKQGNGNEKAGSDFDFDAADDDLRYNPEKYNKMEQKTRRRSEPYKTDSRGEERNHSKHEKNHWNSGNKRKR